MRHEEGNLMGGKIQSGVLAHDNACGVAESIRQSAVASVAQSPAGQKLHDAAEIQWARSCIASCKANNSGNGQAPFIELLRALGTGGQ
jgi:hypothetical protein